MSGATRAISAAAFAAAGAAPGLVIVQLGADRPASAWLFALQLVLLPALCAGFSGALLGPLMMRAGDGLQGLKKSLVCGGFVPLLSLFLWAPASALVAAISGLYPLKLLLFVAVTAATLGGVVIYPIGMSVGALLWLVGRRW